MVLEKRDFDICEIVEHKLTGESMMVIDKGKEQLKCRLTDMREIWVYSYELNKKEH